MAQFTADIAGMLELFAIAAGRVEPHRAAREAPAKLGSVLRSMTLPAPAGGAR